MLSVSSQTAASATAAMRAVCEDALLPAVDLLTAQPTLPSMLVNKEALMRRARCKACALMTR